MEQCFKERFLFVLQESRCTKSKAAELLSVSAAYVSQLCSGQRDPSDRTVRDICRIFGVNEIWLRTGEGEAHTPLSREEELAAIFAEVQIGSDDKSRLIRALARMPDEAFPAMVKFLEELHERLTEA